MIAKSKLECSVLFVCLGNICRSPLAEGVFRDLVKRQGLESSFTIDSCGTGHWHIGELPHPEARAVAKRYNISLTGIRARQIEKADFNNFDLIVAMDQSNLDDLRRIRTSNKGNIICLREYDIDTKDLNVPDPYYGGSEAFEQTFKIVARCCHALFEAILEEHSQQWANSRKR